MPPSSRSSARPNATNSVISLNFFRSLARGSDLQPVRLHAWSQKGSFSVRPHRHSDARTSRMSPLPRSEEHTSELQSRQYLACRLLLETKKTALPPSTI